MNASVPRPCCLGIEVNRARGSKYMLEGLKVVGASVDWILDDEGNKKTQTSNLFRNKPSQGSAESYVQSAYTKSGHWSPATVISLFLRPSLTLQDIRTKSWTTRVTHLKSFQSRPAGQSRDPVTGWWNPRFVLTLREIDGCKTPSRGVIQSTTTPFRLFVSSDLALETPFWIYNGSNKLIFKR
jgi:hypothetical protein